MLSISRSGDEVVDLSMILPGGILRLTEMEARLNSHDTLRDNLSILSLFEKRAHPSVRLYGGYTKVDGWAKAFKTVGWKDGLNER
jgi:hypothetical protein